MASRCLTLPRIRSQGFQWPFGLSSLVAIRKSAGLEGGWLRLVDYPGAFRLWEDLQADSEVMESRVAAVLAVVPLGNSGEESARPFSKRERRELPEAMLLDVLDALVGSRLVDKVAVVSKESDLLSLVDEYPAEGILGEDDDDVDAALERGLALLPSEMEALMLIPYLLPLLKPQDVAFLAGRALDGPRAIIVPSPTSEGTSLLISNPPDVVPVRFREYSYKLHYEEALSRSVPVEVYALDAALGVTQTSDLGRVLTSPRRSRTKNLLKEWGVSLQDR